MPVGDHVIKTGADGTLSGMSPGDVTSVLDRALAADRVVLHFHGGLVNEAKGMQVAESLLPVYTKAGAYPVFFIWQAGAAEIIRNNVLEIAKEEFFERALRRVLSWSVGKVRGEVDGGRGAPVQRPNKRELDDQLAGRNRTSDPDSGREPFADQPLPQPAGPAAGDAHPELTSDDEELFALEVRTDTDLQGQVAGMLASRQLERGDLAGARGVTEAKPVASRIDDEVLAEIAQGADADGARGFVSATVLAGKLLGVLRAVIARYRTQTDSGIYPTVVEELLRAFYLANVGGALWQAMKKETQDTFAPGHQDRGGNLALDQIAKAYGNGRAARVTLVGHSTGGVFIDNLLTAVARSRHDSPRLWPAKPRFQVCYLAPACTTQHFALALDAAEDLIGRFRMFTMTDEAERADRLVGAVYPRSLLYLVSGLLERDRGASSVVPVLGLSRYLAPRGLDRLLDSDTAATGRLLAVRKYAGEADRVVLSPTGDGALADARSAAVSHGAFDDDSLVLDSLVELIRSW